MNTQNTDEDDLIIVPRDVARRPFGWFGVRDLVRTFKQMYRFHRSLDVENALRMELWKGIQMGRKHSTPALPYCDLHNDPEMDTPLSAIAPGIFVCNQCRTFTSAPMPVTRPTIKLIMPQEPERTTGPIDVHARPLFVYRAEKHPDDEAGTDTKQVRAIRLREGKIVS